MTDIKRKYGTSGQTLTITLASLGNNSGRQSSQIDNTTDLFLDVLIMMAIKTGASGVTSSGIIEVRAFASVDGGTTRTDSAGSTDAAITVVNAPLLGVIQATANATTYKAGPWSLAQAFGGIVPHRWGIIVVNRTGGALDSTEGNHTKVYHGQYLQAV